jgi:hypothetical protein
VAAWYGWVLELHAGCTYRCCCLTAVTSIIQMTWSLTWHHVAASCRGIMSWPQLPCIKSQIPPRAVAPPPGPVCGPSCHQVGKSTTTPSPVSPTTTTRRPSRRPGPDLWSSWCVPVRSLPRASRPWSSPAAASQAANGAVVVGRSLDRPTAAAAPCPWRWQAKTLLQRQGKWQPVSSRTLQNHLQLQSRKVEVDCHGCGLFRLATPPALGCVLCCLWRGHTATGLQALAAVLRLFQWQWIGVDIDTPPSMMHHGWRDRPLLQQLCSALRQCVW